MQYMLAHLLFVPHGSPAEHRHLGHGLLLQALHRVALRTQQLAHKVELQTERDGMIHYAATLCAHTAYVHVLVSFP